MNESDEVQQLLAQNKAWAAQVEQDSPGFFERLSNQQKPRFMWIGCADSRVPANQITGLMPGDIFVHRNVANVVKPDDINCMAVVEFAVKVIGVRHIIICGHYGCAGVEVAMQGAVSGAPDYWLAGVRSLYAEHREALSKLDEQEARRRMCELNVESQLKSLAGSSVIQDAWRSGQEVDLHGWVYGIEDGIIRDLDIRVRSPDDL